jgi:hypothetical protein
MNTLEHVVAPEDVMAFVDGELSASDARVVREHLVLCAECALLAEQLRGTSEMLERWEVSAVPGAVEEVVSGKAGEARGWRIFSRGIFGRRFRMWQVVGFGCGAVIAAMLMVSVMNRGNGHTVDFGDQAMIQRAMPIAPPGAVSGDILGSPRSMSPRDYGRAKDQMQALEKRKQQAAMSESLVSNGALADKVQKGIIGGLATSGQAADVNGRLRPMIARMASLTIVVKNVESARMALDAIVAKYQGYPATLNANAPEDGPRIVSGSIRIPAEDLALAIGELRALGRVVNETQSGEDVGQQHTDLVARLKTARETEERFQAILQQRTGKLSDVLEVEENIARVRGDIESMEAEQRAMEHRVDFASVDVQLAEVYKAKLDAPDSVGTRLHNAFVAGYHHAAETVLGLILWVEEFLPALLIWAVILGAPCVWIWRRYKRTRGRVGF